MACTFYYFRNFEKKNWLSRYFQLLQPLANKMCRHRAGVYLIRALDSDASTEVYLIYLPWRSDDFIISQLCNYFMSSVQRRSGKKTGPFLKIPVYWLHLWFHTTFKYDCLMQQPRCITKRAFFSETKCIKMFTYKSRVSDRTLIGLSISYSDRYLLCTIFHR